MTENNFETRIGLLVLNLRMDTRAGPTPPLPTLKGELIYARQHAFLLQAACDCWLRRAVVSLSGTCLAILYEE